MGSKTVAGIYEFDTSEKDGVKVAVVKNINSNEVIKSAIGLPTVTNKSISVAGSIKDFVTSFSGSFSKENKTPYFWTELSKANPGFQLPEQEVKAIDKEIENQSGSPFSNTSQTLYAQRIEPEKVNVSISSTRTSLSPAITINTATNNWFSEWTFSSYLEKLGQRFDDIDSVDILTVENPTGGFQFVKSLEKVATHVRIHTNSNLAHLIPPANNLEIKDDLKDDYRFKPSYDMLKIIIVANREVYTQKFLKENNFEKYVDLYSTDFSKINETGKIYNDIWTGKL